MVVDKDGKVVGSGNCTYSVLKERELNEVEFVSRKGRANKNKNIMRFCKIKAII